MSITHITEFHAASGQESALADLLSEGRSRMRAADGCDRMILRLSPSFSDGVLPRHTTPRSPSASLRPGTSKNC
jgi:hypothetical protein